MRDIKWVDHLINLFVVIAGITIAYSLNNWNESKKIKVQQDTYIESMLEDINFDINELDSLIINDQENLFYYKRLNQARKNPLSKDSMSIAVSKVASLTTFTSRNITYQSIKSSGKFELLNLKLRIDIIEFYHSGYDQIEEIESYYKMNFDSQIIPFLITEAFGSATGLDESALLSDKFKTILSLQINYLAQKIEAYKNGLRLAKKLKDELEASK